MGASSSGTDSVTQKSEPWSQAQPYLKDIFGQAQGLYNSGQQYFPGSTVVPFSPNTQAGMAGLKQQFSQTPMGLDTAMNTMDRVSQGTAGNSLYNQMMQASGAPTTAGIGTLDQMQGGGANPYLDQIFNKAASQVRDNTNAMFSKAGRYGSTANQDALSDSLGNMAANMYGNAYESDQGRRMAAASQLAGIQQNDMARRMGGLNSLMGYGQQGDQMAMQAAMLYPQLNNYAQSGNRGLMELGGLQEQQAGAELQDAMNRWNFGQTGGWDLLNRYNSIVQPMAALGGTSTQSQPGQSALGAGLQGAAGGAMMGSSFGPMGMVVGGGLGALGGLLG